MPSPLTSQLIDFLHSEPRFQPEDELRLHIDGHAFGWVRPPVADAICRIEAARTIRHKHDLHLDTGMDVSGRSELMQHLALGLREAGVLENWRDELMQLDLYGNPFLAMERAAFRTLGLRTPSVHLNGWLISPDGVLLWVAQRSLHKFVDPGRLDNLVGGGVSAGESLADGLAREAWEEAGLHFRHVPAPSSRLYILRRIAEGVQDECIAVHDVWLPSHFRATNQDGEVAQAGLLPLPEVITHLLAGHFTWDAGLVVLDGLLRQRYFGLDGTLAIEQALRTLGYRGIR